MSFHPQTPQSPSQFSPGTSDQNMSMSSSMTSITTALPTPAHSVNGSSLPTDTTQDVVMGGDSPHKRKRAFDDLGDRQQKKMHSEGRKLGIDDLHLDVGDKYLLCRTPHPTPRPHVSEDLFELYGLGSLADSVARVLPNGEKNAIRKTYKGFIKKLGVQGHFDSVKQDPHREDSMLWLMQVPEDVWDARYVRGKDIHHGFNPEVKSKLLRATTMSKGVVPKSVWDSSVLGEIGPGKGDRAMSSARPTAPNTPLNLGGSQQPRIKVGTPVAAQDRAKRAIKKRSYGDSSFEGYGEGFPDDDTGAASGYSTGEGDMASGNKRRKKTHAVSQAYPPARQPVYGAGT
ncbi:putative mediator of RNA polymerase II transcription subunit 19 [Cercophora samala]|uniref:Mediator of RNA polymerase II transcription subunit 19 n=1 Tax=Cercophora samala TaxID=330535 RepID=A0AA39Z9K8_9PEZI|nr:putative mediator of RNA polymerase II transcription subunit 19 [Cercophora samala]